MKLLGWWMCPLDTWGENLPLLEGERFGPSDEIPLVERNGGCQLEDPNNSANKKWGESRVDLPEAMCQTINESRVWSGSG